MMQAVDILLKSPRAQRSTNGDDDDDNTTKIEKVSSISLSGSPARPPVSPITPITPEIPEIVDDDGREVIQADRDDEDTIKPDISKTSQSHKVNLIRRQTQQSVPQTEPKSTSSSATMPASNSASVLVPVPAPPTTYIPRPPSPVPISTSSNPDAIALRSAISLLQMQRQRGQKDMQTLEEIKQAALKDPERFVGELVAGRVKNSGPSGRTTDDLLSASLLDTYDGEQQQQQPKSTPSASKFATVPTPQNIYRCPPINWAKYHVVGESLDKIHAEQIARPPTGDVVGAVASTGEPVNAGGTTVQARNSPYVMSAPYSPFHDTVMMTGQKGNSKSTMGQKGRTGNG